MSEPESEQKRKLYCNRCNRTTNHVLRGQYKSVVEDIDTGLGVIEVEECSLLSCAGCEAPTLVVSYDGYYKEESMYPKRNFFDRSVKKFHKLPPKLTQTYKETVDALNSDCLLLCTIGLRTLLEGICADKKVGGSTLEQQINNLGRHLPTGNITSYLHGFRFSGNDAAHQLEVLTRPEIINAIDVMEDLLNMIYDLDYKASRIKNANKQAAKSFDF
jgi:hypothetical protein